MLLGAEVDLNVRDRDLSRISSTPPATHDAARASPDRVGPVHGCEGTARTSAVIRAENHGRWARIPVTVTEFCLQSALDATTLRRCVDSMSSFNESVGRPPNLERIRDPWISRVNQHDGSIYQVNDFIPHLTSSLHVPVRVERTHDVRVMRLRGAGDDLRGRDRLRAVCVAWLDPRRLSESESADEHDRTCNESDSPEHGFPLSSLQHTPVERGTDVRG